MKNQIKTLGELKNSGYQYKSVHQELRSNLKERIRSGGKVFQGIIGYDDTVLPDLERAILAGHSINFLGLRGQAKTKMARLLLQLFDDYVPKVKGSPLNEDPLMPLTSKTKEMILEFGDDTPISWIHKSERYSEKLATPDVNIADLIGDIDPIKAANLKLSLSDEEAIYYGIIPRSNRGIFVINELPDLQPRIQVALFNLLQERDIQIRGFKLNIPIDIQFIFTSNPEDYTNRGSIITPLKDRIQSQIFTHYPLTNEMGREITKQEVRIHEGQENVFVPKVMEMLIEQIAIEARDNDFVDSKSGVSARLPISAYENVVSAVERRCIRNGDTSGVARISDLSAAIPAIIGKIEMVYEGEQEGAVNVAHRLIGQAIRSIAPYYFSGIDELNQRNTSSESLKKYESVTNWFQKSQKLDLLNDMSQDDYESELNKVSGLRENIEALNLENENISTIMEFLLTSLAEYSLLEKRRLEKSVSFQDYFSSVVGGIN